MDDKGINGLVSDKLFFFEPSSDLDWSFKASGTCLGIVECLGTSTCSLDRHGQIISGLDGCIESKYIVLFETSICSLLWFADIDGLSNGLRLQNRRNQ